MNNFKMLRLKRRLTQLQVAEKAGLSQAYINELETGKKSNPSLETLTKLAEALGVSITEFLEREGRV